MRAGVAPSRALLAVLSSAALLSASALPCPPPARHEHASRREHPAGCEMHASAASVTAACPCGCGDRAPVAGSPARLGVALPSAALDLEPVRVAAHARPTAQILEDSFASPIDHVPLPA